MAKISNYSLSFASTMLITLFSLPCEAAVIGDVDGISSGTISNVDISAANTLKDGISDVVIMTGTINNNYVEGCQITFSTSAATTAAFGFQGTGDIAAISGTRGDFIQITGLKLNSTGGTVGHSTVWSDTAVRIPTRGLSTDMTSGTQTQATVNETIEIKATTASKTSLLEGSYSLDLTVTYTNLGT